MKRSGKRLAPEDPMSAAGKFLIGLWQEAEKTAQDTQASVEANITAAIRPLVFIAFCNLIYQFALYSAHYSIFQEKTGSQISLRG
jgi:hypothetical protein